MFNASSKLLYTKHLAHPTCTYILNVLCVTAHCIPSSRFGDRNQCTPDGCHHTQSRWILWPSKCSWLQTQGWCAHGDAAVIQVWKIEKVKCINTLQGRITVQLMLISHALGACCTTENTMSGKFRKVVMATTKHWQSQSDCRVWNWNISQYLLIYWAALGRCRKHCVSKLKIGKKKLICKIEARQVKYVLCVFLHSYWNSDFSRNYTTQKWLVLCNDSS